MFSQDFQENEMLQSFFTILSTNIAKNGAHFVSTFEGYKVYFLLGKLKDFHETALYQEIYCFVITGKRYPFYGVQWHPEVNRFQWYRKANFPHSRHAVQLSSELAEFFVNEGNMTSMHYQKTYTAQQN